MSTVVTHRPISLAQLGDELGTDMVSMADAGTVRIVTCHNEQVTDAQLQAAIDAHTPEPPAPTEAEVIANLKARMTATDQALDQIIIDALMGDFPPI